MFTIRQLLIRTAGIHSGYDVGVSQAEHRRSDRSLSPNRNTDATRVLFDGCALGKHENASRQTDGQRQIATCLSSQAGNSDQDPSFLAVQYWSAENCCRIHRQSATNRLPGPVRNDRFGNSRNNCRPQFLSDHSNRQRFRGVRMRRAKHPDRRCCTLQ